MKIYLVNSIDDYDNGSYVEKAFKSRDRAISYISQQKKEYKKSLAEAKKCDKCMKSTKKRNCFIPSKEDDNLCQDEFPSNCIIETEYRISTTELEE